MTKHSLISVVCVLLFVWLDVSSAFHLVNNGNTKVWTWKRKQYGTNGCTALNNWESLGRYSPGCGGCPSYYTTAAPTSEIHYMIRDTTRANGKYYFAMTSGLGMSDTIDGPGTAVHLADCTGSESNHVGKPKFMKIFIDSNLKVAFAISLWAENIVVWSLDASHATNDFSTIKFKLALDFTSHKFIDAYYVDNTASNQGGNLFIACIKASSNDPAEPFDIYNGGACSTSNNCDAQKADPDANALNVDLTNTFAYTSRGIPFNHLAVTVTTRTTGPNTGRAWFVGTQGYIAMCPKDSGFAGTNPCTSKKAGIPGATYTSISWYTEPNVGHRLIVGAGGLYAELDPDDANWKITRLFFLPDFPQIVAMYSDVDPLQTSPFDVRHSTIWMATKGITNTTTTIHRVSVRAQDGLFPFPEFIAPVPNNADHTRALYFEGGYVYAAPMTYISGAPADDSSKVFKAQISECISYNCIQCEATDPNYCGICTSTQNSCASKVDCLANISPFGFQCPSLTSASPSSGSTEGGTDVVLTGVGFNTNPGVMKCKFGSGALFNPTGTVTSTSMTCKSPAWTGGSGATHDTSITVWADDGVTTAYQFMSQSVPFQYYDCTYQECGTPCNSLPECKWCVHKAQCTSQAQCTISGIPTIWTGICPSLTYKNNPMIPTESYSRLKRAGDDLAIRNTLITTSSPLYSTITYQCHFGSPVNTAVSATVQGASPSTTLKCNDIPVAPSEAVVNLTVTIANRPWTNTPLSFTYYDCDVQVPCLGCITAQRPLCNWCPGTQLLCAWKTNPTVTCNVAAADSCPGIDAYSPKSWRVGSATIDIDITVSGFVNDPALRCKFFYENGTVLTSVTQFISAINVKCPIPSGAFDGQAQLQIFSDQTAYTAKVPFLFYECSVQPSCGTCLDPLRAGCHWCNEQGALSCGFGTGSCDIQHDLTSAGTCPSLQSITPNRVNLNGREILLEGDFKLPASPTGIECDFGSEGKFAAVSVNNTHIVCIAPAVVGALNVSVTVMRDNATYTNGLNLEYYDCHSLTTCGTCTSNSYECGWCGIECRNDVACGLDSCPTLDSMSPEEGMIEGNEQVYIVGGPFAPSLAYNCLFKKLISPTTELEGYAARMNDTHIQCTTPTFTQTSKGSDVLVQVTLKVGATTQYAPESTPLNFKFFDCDMNEPATFSCSNILQNCHTVDKPRCGICLIGNNCTADAKCPSNLFISDSCPAINDAGLSTNHASIGDNSTVISVPMNSAFNFSSSDQFECQFGIVGTSPAIWSVNWNTGVTTFNCTPPFTSTEGAQTLTIVRNGDALTAGTTFTFVDCVVENPVDASDYFGNNGVCKKCQDDKHAFCGFCLPENSCGIKSECENQNQWLIDDCPEIGSVNPISATLSDLTATQMTITGTYFMNDTADSQIHVGWLLLPPTKKRADVTEPQLKNFTIISVTEDKIIAIPTPIGVGDQKISVWMKRRISNGVYADYPYATNHVPFEIKPDTLVAIDSTPVAAGVAVPIGVILIIIAIILVVLRQKKIGMFSVDLVEPNYLEIAFGSDLIEQYRFPEEGYKLLETVLANKDRTFLFTFSRSVQPTEHDKVAKGYVEVFHKLGKSKEMIIAFISEEVGREKSENTIFRANSITSKMFKFYSKVVGTKFLWSKTARLILELNTLGAQKMKKGGDTDEAQLSGGASLFTLDMELDPTKIAVTKSFEEEVDAQANVYQLILTCQKVFGTLTRSLKEMPDEFKEIFISCQDAIKSRFDSQDAVYKAIGGFLFLRFVCPAFTAPHAYGLLDAPPNDVCQRQLVLIGKVLQNLANMTMPGNKEEFMQQLNDFFKQNIPKMEQFYKDILGPSKPSLQVLPIGPEDVSETVRLNALSNIWSVIHNSAKVTKQIDTEYADDNETKKRLHEIVRELHEKYPKAPRKAKQLKKQEESKKKEEEAKRKKKPSRQKVLGHRDLDAL